MTPTQFDTVGFMEWVRLAPVERAKGVVRIPEGTLLINRQGQDLNIETRPLAPLDSRIELITAKIPTGTPCNPPCLRFV